MGCLNIYRINHLSFGFIDISYIAMNNSPTLLTHLKPAGEGQIEPLLEMVQGESWRESHLTTPGNARKMYFDFSVRLVERVQRFNPRRPEAQIRGSLINNLKQMEDGRWTWKHDRRRGIRRNSGGEMNEAAWADLAQVRAPTLVVRGAESNMLSPQTPLKCTASSATVA